VCLEVDRARSEWAGWLAEAASRGWEIEDVLPACPAHVAAVAGSNPFLGFAVSRKTLRTVQDRIALSRKTRDPSELRDAAPGDRPLRRILSSFRRRNRPPIRRDLLGSGIPCPVCKRLDLARDRALSLLFALLEARPHRRRYEGGYGLCFRHFLRALALHPPEHTRGILREVESAQLARLQWELEEFVRKEAWSNRPEAAGTECTAWRRAVERFSGRVTEGAG
jgi:hypothetical protein